MAHRGGRHPLAADNGTYGRLITASQTVHNAGYGRAGFLCLEDLLDLVDGCFESYGEEKGE
jgi:hypothetical protein